VVDVLIIIGLILIWLVPGFFGARMMLLDFDAAFSNNLDSGTYIFAIFIMFAGWVGWAVSLMMSSGVFAEAHFLNKIPRIPPIVFIQNWFKKERRNPLSIFFRV